MNNGNEVMNVYEQANLEQVVSERDPFTIERYTQFCRYFTPSTKYVLDIGCNTGRGGTHLKKMNSNLVLHGLDCVQERLDNLPKDYDEKIYGLSNKIPAKDRTYDAIVAGEFLEHLYPSDVDSTICEFQRVLKLRGRLLMTTPNPYYLRNKLKNRSVYSDAHLTQHYPKLLKQRLLMHGFSNVRILGSGKMSRYIGYHFPVRNLYGSFFIAGDKT